MLLLVYFTLPIQDTEGIQDILDLVANLHLSTVQDELGRSSAAPDVILKGVHKLLVSLHAFNVSHKGFSTNGKLHIHVPTVNGQSIGVDSIHSDGLVVTMDIKSGLGGLEVMLEVSTHGHASILSSAGKSLLNHVER
jgi:hypothetical protein